MSDESGHVFARFCRGCKVECNEDRASLGNAYIAVDWDPTALHLRYQTSQERVSAINTYVITRKLYSHHYGKCSESRTLKLSGL